MPSNHRILISPEFDVLQREKVKVEKTLSVVCFSDCARDHMCDHNLQHSQPPSHLFFSKKYFKNQPTTSTQPKVNRNVSRSNILFFFSLISFSFPYTGQDRGVLVGAREDREAAIRASEATRETEIHVIDVEASRLFSLSTSPLSYFDPGLLRVSRYLI